MGLERFVEVKHRILWRVKARKELVDDDENFRVFAIFEGSHDGAIVAFLVAVALHHLFPEADDFFAGFIPYLVIPFAVVGGRDDHFRRDHADLIKRALVEQRRALGAGGELRLEAGTLPVLGKMLGDIVGDAIDGRLGLADLAVAREFSFEVGALVRGQVPADALKPDIDAFPVHILLDVASFVEQRHDSAVLYRLIDGIDVNESPKFHGGALFLLHQRRAGEAEIAGVREHPLHAGVHFAVLAAMAFIDQQEYVARQVAVIADIQGRVELVDDRRDDRGAIL